MNVLVAGATGYLGRHVVAANVCDPNQLAGCCTGVDTVISTVGLMNASARTSFHDVDFLGNQNLLREAKRGGVGRFVYTSVLQRPGMERLAIVKAKLDFEHELDRSDIENTVLRPNGYFSDMDQFLAMARKGRVWVFGDGQFKINPIDGADVARAAVDAVDGGPAILELGGPQVLTHNDIAHAAFAALGAEPRITSIPTFAAHALATTMHHLTPARIHGAPEFVLTVLSRDLIAPTTGTTTISDHFQGEASS